MYKYRGTVTRVVDGDTVDMKVDLGFRTFMELRFRLHGIDTPERGKPGWVAATDHLMDLTAGLDIVAETRKDPDNFGRWLCVLYGDGLNINQRMIDDGYAVEYKR